MRIALIALIGSILGILFYKTISPDTLYVKHTPNDWGLGTIAYVGRVKEIDYKSRAIIIDAETEFPDFKTVPVKFKYDGETDFFYTINNAREDILYGQKVARINSSSIVHEGARVAVQKSYSTPTGLYARQLTMLTP